MKEWLLGKTLTQLQEIVSGSGMQNFIAAQIARWLYLSRAKSIDAMHNLSAKNREILKEKYEAGGFEPLQTEVSADGTKKYVFPVLVGAGDTVETVMIPDGDRATLCVSSQAGCALHCQFCMTGRMGLKASLSAGEIVGQILRIAESEQLSNIVYMGMGEPLNNWDQVKRSIDILCSPWGLAWSPRRITVSTVGILPKLPLLLNDTRVNVALSLHNPFPRERAALIPAENAYPIESIISCLNRAAFHAQRRLSFEYILFADRNDSPRHATALIRLLRSKGPRIVRDCRVNLLRFHEIPDSPLRRAPEERMLVFQKILNEAGIRTTLRQSRGEDIQAACGLLSTRKNKENA